MDISQIDAAKARAQQVIDGMSRVKDQQARDVINLVRHAAEQDDVIRRLKNKIEELEKSLESEKIFRSNPFGSIFK